MVSNYYKIKKKSFFKNVFMVLITTIFFNAHNIIYAQSIYQMSNSISFSDTNFKVALINSGLDQNNNGEIELGEASLCDSLNIGFKNISSLDGIQFFPALRVLLCKSNNLSNINLSNNTNLEKLDCSINTSLNSINLSGLQNLKELSYNNCNITSIDLSTNFALEKISAQGNSMTSIDLSNNLQIKHLDIGNNLPFSNLNLTQLSNLRYLDCSALSLNSVNLSNNDSLIYVDVNNNPITNLDVSNLLKLETLICVGTAITSINISTNSNLLKLDCSSTAINNVDFTSNFNLKELNVSSCNISSLNISNNLKLNRLDCALNNLNQLNISNNDSLEVLNCGFNQLTSINFTNNLKLKYIDCSHNLISSIDLSQNTNLSSLFCNNNQLINLNANNGNSDHLLFFDCSLNPNLSCISVSNPDSIPQDYWVKDDQATYNLSCQSNSIQSLECSNANQLGQFVSGVNLTNCFASVPYTGGNGDSYNALSINSTGVTGLIAHLTAGSFAIGNGNLTFQIFGIPNSAGNAFFNLSIGGQNCLFSILVTNIPYTKIKNIDCGKINLAPGIQVACNAVANATNYEFEFRDIATNNLVLTRVNTVNLYTPSPVGVGTLQWNTQYSCRVRAKVAGIWGEFGTACTIGLGQNPTINGVANTKLENK